MDVAAHFRIIWNNRLLVLGTALVAALVVLIWRSNEPATFAAETTVQVVAAPDLQGSRPSGDDAVFMAEGYAERATTTPVLEAAVQRLEQWRPEKPDDHVSAHADPRTGVITIAARAPNAADAAALSDAVARQLVSTIESEQQQVEQEALAPLQQQIAQASAELAALPVDDPSRPSAQARLDALTATALDIQMRPTDRLAIVSPADPDSGAVAPRPSRDSLLAFLLVLVLAAEGVVVAAAISDRFSRGDLRHDVAAAAGLPVLASVPAGPDDVRREAFAELRTNLALMTPAFDAPTSIAVMPVDRGAESASTAAELARAAASGSRPVLLIDADMRNPSLHERFGLQLSPGLSDLLRGASRSLGRLPTDPEARTVRVLTAGAPLADTAMAITQRFRQCVLEPSTRTTGLLTLVATPPAVPISDAAVVADQCDLNILVIDARSTSRRTLRDALDRLAQVGIVPTGIVLDETPHAPSADAEPVPEPASATAAEVDELPAAVPASARIRHRLAIALGVPRQEIDVVEGLGQQ